MTSPIGMTKKAMMPTSDEKCQCGHEERDHAGFAGCAGSKPCKCEGFTPVNERKPFND